MNKKPTCFVIIGYGKKVSYADGTARTLDLDQTFKYLIKPVFDDLDIDCYRAIDKNKSGSIDKLMLQEIKNADIALVDLSTLNANVMWELGVRHALRPSHTIMICEKKQMNSIPFDISSFIIHQYAHSEEGIPFTEVDRFRTHLKQLITDVLAQDPAPSDSPVHVFIGDELRLADEADGPSFAELMDEAENEKKQGNFTTALALYDEAIALSKNQASLKENLPFLISRKALCTYKSKLPDEESALKKADKILAELNPQKSMDVEVLGLNGAINKRLFELTGEDEYLENAIASYERGYEKKNDYYNGINASFMLYKKAAKDKADGLDFDDSKTDAEFYRNKCLKVALALEKEDGFLQKQDAIWVLLTIAEAYNYKGDEAKMKAYETKAEALAKQNNDNFAMASYNEQKAKIKTLINSLNT